MSRRHAGAGPGGSQEAREEWLAAMLRAEADRHIPDRDALRARLGRDVRPIRGVSGRSQWSLVRQATTVAAAAAATVVAFVGIRNIGLAAGEAPAGQKVVASVAVSTSRTPTAAATSQADPSPVESPPSTLAPAVSASNDTPSTPQNRSTSAGQTSTGPVSITWAGVQQGGVVSLPHSNDRDWAVFGSRGDHQIVRWAHATQSLNQVGVSGAQASVVNGPYNISWSEGTSEQSRFGDMTWLTVPADRGVITLATAARTSVGTLKLYIGTIGTSASVTARLTSSGASATTIVPSGGSSAPFVVVIRFTAPADGEDINVEVRGAGNGRFTGQLGLAAVELR